MGGLEIGCSTIAFNMLSRGEALDRIASLGFTSVEIGVVRGFCDHFDPTLGATERAAILKDLADRQLSAHSLNTALFTYSSPKDRETMVAHADEVFALAAELGCGVVLCGGPRDPDWQAGARRWAEYIRADLARARDGFGVETSIEAPHRGMTGQSLPETIAFLEMIDEPALGLAYDASHVVGGGASATDSLVALSPRIRHVHARDARHGDIHLTPGDGEYDWDSLMAHLVRNPLRRPLSLELEYGGRLTPDQISAEALRARDFLAQRYQLAAARVAQPAGS